MADVELKPCPFCAGRAQLNVGYSAFFDAQIDCMVCGASGPNHDESAHLGEDAKAENKAAAIAAWNTRKDANDDTDGK